MASNQLSLGLLIGGAVSGSLNAAFRTVEGSIDQLQAKGRELDLFKAQTKAALELGNTQRRSTLRAYGEQQRVGAALESQRAAATARLASLNRELAAADQARTRRLATQSTEMDRLRYLQWQLAQEANRQAEGGNKGEAKRLRGQAQAAAELYKQRQAQAAADNKADAEKVRGIQRRIEVAQREAQQAKRSLADQQTEMGRLRNVLRDNAREAGRLGDAFRQAAREAQGIKLQASGMARLEAGKSGMRSTVGQAVAGTAALAVPTKISADYQAIVRDIAIKAGVAGSAEERDLSRTVITTSRDTGMARNEVADVINQLVSAGMDLDVASGFSPVAAKFVVGQGAGGVDTARMMQALQQNAKISDPRVMEKALEAIAFQGQAGSFEASDMARWFPQLLAEMGKLEIFGMDAVTQLGSMLQVQMKTAGGADEAANNLKNWMAKIGSSDVVRAYQKAGIDYQGSLNTGLQNGMSTLEASFALAQQYIQRTDPAKAKKMAEATAAISKEADPAKARAMMEALEQTLRTGDIFADMQVKAALTAYTQNKALYESLKRESASATGILDQNLRERREASAQRWAEVAQAANEGMRAVGDAIRPMTDAAADALRPLFQGLTRLTDAAPGVTAGVVGVGAALVVLRGIVNAWRIGRGLMDIARGRSMMGNPNIVQRVFVTNPGAGGLGGDVGGGSGRRGRAGGGRSGRLGAAGRGAWGVLRGAGRFAKGAGPLALVGAGLQAADTFVNAETRDEKAEGYGAALGGLGGTLAGAAAGAAIGSVVPIIGTAIGGLIGGMIGAWGGSELGAAGGKALFGSGGLFGGSPPAEPAKPAVLPVTAVVAEPAKPAPVPVKQEFSFSPNISLTVQGDAKDPQALLQAIMPELRRQLADFAGQMQRVSLFDEPNV
ncbi:phage tail tape measure protein [Pseudomonas aeruginosa]|nr:phage tail tape measure protein [Pseudomonas aeruginosa]